jgi:hypothetical protein
MYRYIKQMGLSHRYDALCTDDLVLCCPSVNMYFILTYKFQVFFFKYSKIAIILWIVFVYLFCFRFSITRSLSIFLFSASVRFFSQGFISMMPITCFDYTAGQRNFFPKWIFQKMKERPGKYPSLKYLSFNVYL